MTSGLNTRPNDDELAVEFRWTLHTRWGVGGFHGYEGEGDDFTCMCPFRKGRLIAMTHIGTEAKFLCPGRR